MEDNFDYIDFVQNKRLQENLSKHISEEDIEAYREWETGNGWEPETIEAAIDIWRQYPSQFQQELEEPFVDNLEMFVKHPERYLTPEMDAPVEVTDRVKKMAQAMVDPELGNNIMKAALKEETHFELDPEGDAMNRVNEALQDDGWIFNGNDEDGCSFYKKAGYEIRVKVQLV